MTTKKVPIADIDLENGQFNLSYLTDRGRLTESIRQVGLLHPVVLRSADSQGRCQIVSGFQRIRSCIDLDMKYIDGIVHGREELPDAKALLLTLHQTATSREMNLIEKSLALKRLSDTARIDDERLRTHIMPLLNLEPSEKVIRSVVGLWELTDGVKAYIVQGGVTLGNAIRFLEFPLEDLDDLLELISPLRLNTNRLKEFLTLVIEICRRDDVSVREIIDGETRDILADSDIPTPQKGERIRRRLRKRRFPQMAAVERD